MSERILFLRVKWRRRGGLAIVKAWINVYLLSQGLSVVHAGNGIKPRQSKCRRDMCCELSRSNRGTLVSTTKGVIIFLSDHSVRLSEVSGLLNDQRPVVWRYVLDVVWAMYMEQRSNWNEQVHKDDRGYHIGKEQGLQHDNAQLNDESNREGVEYEFLVALRGE